MPVLVRMQAYAGTPDGLPGPDLPPAAGELLLVVNTALPMSAGKALAQIAHGALLASVDDDRVVRVAGAEGDVWDRLAGQADAVVRDGGLTELEPGSGDGARARRRRLISNLVAGEDLPSWLVF